MRILVDTSVWSMALRRKQNSANEAADKLRSLIDGGEQIFLLGVILQEILSGIADKALFDRLADYLAAFPLVELGREAYVAAAELRNKCRKNGIQAGTIDFLIASTCIEKGLLLFTLDKDFEAIASLGGLKLLKSLP